jgi:two-component system C4-dicarboxylate transport sensor histidine kinase DctB
MARFGRIAARVPLESSVIWGFLGGLAYTLVDGYLDHTFGAQTTAPARPVEVFHAIIDFVLPTITGTLLGVSVHYVRLRARMADLEKRRADELSGDLHKIERDQAVWVISASLLHELKNPLHALGLLLDEALDAHQTEPDLQKQLLVRARSQVERIASELATLRALPSSTPQHVPVIDIEEVVRRVTRTFIERVQRCQVNYHGDLPGEYLGQANPAYLRIIVENLLENAVEAVSELTAPAERRVEVHVGKERGECWVEVSDNGPGVDAEVAEHLFEPLTTTKRSGMGLGLSIARTLARAMGGDLLLVDATYGARFRLVLLGSDGT